MRGIRTSTQLRSEELNVHRDSKDNNPSTPFEFSEANLKVGTEYFIYKSWNQYIKYYWEIM